MREVFLDKLPTKDGVGKNIGRKVIDWKGSVGYRLSFIYDDIEGEFEILNIRGDKLSIRYSNKELFEIRCGDLARCKIGSVLGVVTKAFKFETGQVFKDDKRDLIITNREYRNGCGKTDGNTQYKWYEYKCNKCGYSTGWIRETHLKRGCGCSCCCDTPRVVVLGVNTIWDTDRWMCDLGVSEEDAKKYTKSSGKKINVICPECKKEKKIRIYSIYSKKTIGCEYCSDSVSYPEKIIISIINKLGIGFAREYSPEWAKPRRYDFYIPSLNMIIETHGIQHYEESSRGRTLKEEKDNDMVKKKLALSNGIKHYIELDCKKSDLIWIKNSILNSKLNEMFDLTEIDWLQCEEFALSNLTKEICSYWNKKKEWETPQTIADDNPWGIQSKSSIINHLKIGKKHNWCKYITRNDMKVEILKDGEILGTFTSCTELSEKSENILGVKLNAGKISEVCLGKRKSHKGFTFKYIEDQQIAS